MGKRGSAFVGQLLKLCPCFGVKRATSGGRNNSVIMVQLQTPLARRPALSQHNQHCVIGRH